MAVRVNRCAVCVGTRRQENTTGFRAVTAAGASSSAASDGTCCQETVLNFVIAVGPTTSSFRANRRNRGPIFFPVCVP